MLNVFAFNIAAAIKQLLACGHFHEASYTLKPVVTIINKELISGLGFQFFSYLRDKKRYFTFQILVKLKPKTIYTLTRGNLLTCKFITEIQFSSLSMAYRPREKGIQSN